MYLFLKILSGMANSADPIRLGLHCADPIRLGLFWVVHALFAYAIFSDHLVFKILGHLLYKSFV